MSQEIRAVLSCGVDYYKGDKPIKGVDYFTQEDIDEIVQQVEAGGIDLSDYAKKSYVDTAIQGLDIPSTTGLASEQYVDNAIQQINIPTKVSDLDNDSGFITSIPTATTSTIGGVKVDGSTILIDQNGVISSTANLSDYATKSYVNTAIGNIDSLKKQVVNALPLSDIDTNTIYMVPSVTSSQDNVYEEFIYVNGSWEIIGDTQVDLTNYATKSYVDSAVSAIPAPTTYTAGQGIRIQNNVISTTGQFSGNYNDLRNKPELIPAISATADLEIGDYKLVALVMKEEIPPEEEEGEAQEITVADYSWVPDTQELPVASSTTLGCVKIDNNTIKINNGVISATSAAYTLPKATHYAIGGVKIDNQTIQIDQYGMISTTNQFSGSYNDLTDKPAAYTLPVATTSTLGGVKVDGETITIADGVISAAGSGSGGATYTAGQGIDIDSNNVIKTYNSMLMFVTDMVKSDYKLTKNEIVERLLKGQVIQHSGSSTVNSLSKADLGITTGQFTVFGPMNSNGLIPHQTDANSITLIEGFKYYLMPSEKTLASYNPEKIMFILADNTYSLLMDLPLKPTDYTGNTWNSLGTYINKVNALNTRIPSNTNTNGTYKLQSSTTAGNATYSWVEDTGGGTTYTAGQGITINNNTISTVLPVMNPNEGNGSYTLKAFIEQEEETAWDDELEEDVPTGDYISTLRYDWAYDETQPFPECQESTTGTYKLVATITEEEDTYYDEELDEEVGTGNYTQSLNYDWVPDTSSSSTYVLPTATTSTLGGVKVDGSTITINDGVISATSTGGASYTAGNGIDIDSNNVISNKSFPVEVLIKTSHLTPSSLLNNIGTEYIQSYGNTIDRAGLAEKLKTHKIIYISNSPYSNSDSLKIRGRDLIDGSSSNSLSYIAYDGFSNGILYISNASSGYSPRDTEYLYWDGAVLHAWKNVGDIIKNLPIDSDGTKMAQFIQRIPANTATNGTYKLQSSTTAGNATYSWVEDSSSGGLPQAPSTTGSYILITTVAENSTTQTWESVQIGGSY